MDASAEFCDFCELPMANCIHGMPPPPPPPPPVAKKSAPAKPRVRKAATTTPAKSSTRRWTQPAALAPVIVSVLQDAGGELEAKAFFAELELRVQDQFLAGDRETTPEGELRWQYAARRARQTLINDEVMVKGRGVWHLTERGQKMVRG